MSVSEGINTSDAAVAVSLESNAEVNSLQSKKDSLTEGNNGFDIIILESRRD